jgi:hypothetical protein
VASEDDHFLPNKIGRILLLSLEEVVGHNGVNAALNVAGLPDLIHSYPPNTLDREFSFSAVGRIHQALDRLYGLRRARLACARDAPVSSTRCASLARCLG